MEHSDLQVLEEFMNCPVKDTEEIFSRFEALPGAIVGRGEDPMERYVCIPGTRKDRIVLAAHADTVWDRAYGTPAEQKLVFADGCFRSGDPLCGIGADDRAGCAMLWLLRESGHTILLTAGEEKGQRGANFLRRTDPGLFRMLNKHRFMIALDSFGCMRCNFSRVDNTKKFRSYVTEKLGFRDEPSGGSDLKVLCRSVCGVNLGVGYYGQHTPEECLLAPEWEYTLAALRVFLAEEHPRFGTSVTAKLHRLPGRLKNCLAEIRKRR